MMSYNTARAVPKPRLRLEKPSARRSTAIQIIGLPLTPGGARRSHCGAPERRRSDEARHRSDEHHEKESEQLHILEGYGYRYWLRVVVGRGAIGEGCAKG